MPTTLGARLVTEAIRVMEMADVLAAKTVFAGQIASIFS
jgi:hypothetical protein